MKNKESIFIVLLLILSTISFFRLIQTQEKHSNKLNATKEVAMIETTVEETIAVAVIEGPASAIESAQMPVTEGLGEDNAVVTRLKELDAEIEKNDSENDSSSYSMNEKVESEWKLWQAELDLLLNGLENVLTEAEFSQLFQEQKEWMKERESRAIASSQGKTSAYSEEVQYTLSLCADTRERAYELAILYGSLIP